MTEEGRGFLRVRVTEAGQSLPVENAVVSISDYSKAGEGTLLYTLRTDSGGLTPAVALPAPPASMSQQPGSELPYALYNITVLTDGYYPAENVGVPIFDRVVAVQPVNLIPLSEADAAAGATDGQIVLVENRPYPQDGNGVGTDA